MWIITIQEFSVIDLKQTSWILLMVQLVRCEFIQIHEISNVFTEYLNFFLIGDGFPKPHQNNHCHLQMSKKCFLERSAAQAHTSTTKALRIKQKDVSWPKKPDISITFQNAINS